jgi:hypothetical protein
MRNLLALIGLAVLLFVGFGWRLGWFDVHRRPATAGHQEVDIDFNAKKIDEDLKKGGESLAEKSERLLERIGDKNGPTPSRTSGPTAQFSGTGGRPQ